MCGWNKVRNLAIGSRRVKEGIERDNVTRKLIRGLVARERPTVKINAEKIVGGSRENKIRPSFSIPSFLGFPFEGFLRSISSLASPRGVFPERKGSLYPCSARLYYRQREPIAFRLLYNRGCKWWPYPLAPLPASPVSRRKILPSYSRGSRPLNRHRQK